MRSHPTGVNIRPRHDLPDVIHSAAKMTSPRFAGYFSQFPTLVLETATSPGDRLNEHLAAPIFMGQRITLWNHCLEIGANNAKCP
jgi:hypothetical protein